MSSNTTLARPYARAAFELARGSDDLSGWGSALEASAAVVTNEGVAEWLKSPDLDRNRAVQFITETIGGELDERFTRFLAVLAANDRLSVLPEVAELFAELRQEAENRLEVRVVSASPLEDDQARRMKAALARRFDCEIELDNEVDPGVLGGAVIYAGDEVIDGSLKGRLRQMENSLY